jgi:site-specific DNA-cytosine methylase
MESVDFAETSNATIKMDILDLDVKKLPFVPDFVWISFDCSTYSNAAGGWHRSAKKGRFEKTSKAKLNNLSFLKAVRICKWARSLHPHLIIAIENPVGQLQFMPLMVSV